MDLLRKIDEKTNIFSRNFEPTKKIFAWRCPVETRICEGAVPS